MKINHSPQTHSFIILSLISRISMALNRYEQEMINSSMTINHPPSSSSSSSSAHHLTLNRIETALNRNKDQQGQFREATLGMPRRHYHNTLLLAAQGTLAKSLKDKDAQVKHAVRRANQLQNRLAQSKTEALAWHAMATEQQQILSALQEQVRQANAAMEAYKAKVEDQEGSGETSTDGDAESVYVDPERVRLRGLQGVCRECEDKAATVVVMPCQHLCLCVECNEEVAPVPCHVCRCIRTGCFQVLLS